MKSILLFTLSLFLFSTIHSNASPLLGTRHGDHDPNLCLELDGKISFDNEPSDSECRISLMCNGRLIDSVLLRKGRKSFKLLLKRNLFYALKISKKGYIDKMICINTNLPPDAEDEDIRGLYKFKFYTKLVKEQEIIRFDRDLLDFPIALILYNDKKGYFFYDKKYTASIKRQLRKSV